MPRFSIAQPLKHTPPFVLWTLAKACPLRETSEVADPAVTERLLRGVRCYSDALAEGRLHEDVVLTTTNTGERLGFQVPPVLEPLGGRDFISQACGECPANAIRCNEPTALAGCVGYLVPPENDVTFHQRFDAIVAAAVSTTPRWHGLWLASPLSPSLLDLHTRVWLEYQAVENKPFVHGLDDFLAAVLVARKHSLALHVQLFPSGDCEGRRWTVAAHCGRCIASWPEARRQQCRVCGQVGGRQPERVRRRMGMRPYRALSEFLTPEQIANLSAAVLHRE